MNADNVSAWATLGATTLAAIGLLITGWQLRTANKANDFEGLMALRARMFELEGEHSAAHESKNAKSIASVDNRILNTLEMHAVALEKGMLSKTTREFTRQFNIDLLALLESYADLSTQAMTAGPKDWEHLKEFARSHRSEINLKKAQYAANDAAQQHTAFEIERRGSAG